MERSQGHAGRGERPPTPRMPLVVLLVAMLAVSACASRLSTEEIIAANSVGSSSGVAVGQSGSDGSGGFSPTQSGVDGTTTTTIAGQQPTGTGAGTDAGAGTVSGPTAGGSPGAQPGQESGGPTVVANGKPIVVGFIGDMSGVGAGVHIPKRDALKVWEQMINDRGGINGHPVEILIGDNGSNEAQAASFARDFIDNRGAVALSVAGPTESSAVKYAQEKGVPVIGVQAGATDLPMMFIPSPGGEAFNAGWAALASAKGFKKAAIFFCAESSGCDENANSFTRFANQLGIEVVYSGRISVTQPDYTAECLQARRAGAEVILPIADNASPIRMAQSCSRQDYDPTWMIISPEQSHETVPEFEGAIAPTDTFPWILRTGNPLIEEYTAAFETYLPSRFANGSRDMASAWFTAKVMEKAFENIAADATPSAELVLEGLYAMKGETLGGLAPGPLAITFERDQPSRKVFCAMSAEIENGKWVVGHSYDDPVCL